MKVMDRNSWAGREQTQEDVVHLATARRMQALLNRSPDLLDVGSELPYGWHWFYAQTITRRSAWGPDGHMRGGSFLPLLPDTRRMWAGGSLRFLRRLHIGDRIERRSTILSLDEKPGRTGNFFLLCIGHEIHGPSGLAIEEQQNLVYLPGSARTRVSEPTLLSESTDWRESVHTDEVLLFYFSALTMNGHRIHYDYRYATEQEGYPGIVVHAPLSALLLLDAAQSRAGNLAQFSYRATAPLFCGEQITLTGKARADGSLDLWCLRPDGGIAMQATALPAS